MWGHNGNNQQANAKFFFRTLVFSVSPNFSLSSGLAGWDFVCFIRFEKNRDRTIFYNTHRTFTPRQNHEARVTQHTSLEPF